MKNLRFLIPLLLLCHMARADTVTGVTFKAKIGEPGFPQYTHTLILNGVSNRTYSNCTFDGDGIKLDGCSAITFDHCTFQNAKRTSGNNHAIFVGSCNGLTINACTIQDSIDAGQLYNVQNLTFTNNTIQRVIYGVKGSVGGMKHWNVKGNLIRHCQAMGFEFQYDDANTDDIYFGYNAYADADRWSNDASNQGPRMAFSLPFTKATHVIIENNYADGLSNLIDAPGQQRASSANWKGVRLGIEWGGNGAICRNNWILRLNDPGSCIPGSVNCAGGPNLIEKSNLEPFNMQGGAANGSNSFQKNDSTVILPAAGGWNLVGAVPSGATPPPTQPVDPTVALQKLIDELTAKDATSTALIQSLRSDIAAIRDKLAEAQAVPTH